MNYFISDTHIGHENILKYDGRPFSSIEEHDDQIIENVNSILSRNDTLYHLGDVAWSEKSFGYWNTLIRKDITVIYLKGNHDHRFKASKLWKDVLLLKEGPGIWLSHYPHLSWPNGFHGSLHLFGHVHGMTKGVGNSLDVSCNMIDYKPICQEEVFSKLIK